MAAVRAQRCWRRLPRFLDLNGSESDGGVYLRWFGVRLFPAVAPKTARALTVLGLLSVLAFGFILGVEVAPYVLPSLPRFRGQSISQERFARARHVALVTGCGCGATAAGVLIHLVHSSQDLLPTLAPTQANGSVAAAAPARRSRND